jgi:hypothetical protein
VDIASTRINLFVPLELAILIEKECDKLGLTRTQYIKTIIYEKIKRNESKETSMEIKQIKEELQEVKQLLTVLLSAQKNKSTS